MIYRFNFNDFYNKNNSKKFIVLGVILLAIGVYCISRKNMSVNVFSWGIGLMFLYIAWMFFKDFNELKKYAPKNEVRQTFLMMLISIFIALLLFNFPKEFNIILSILIGVWVIVRTVAAYFDEQSYYYRRMSIGFLLKILIGAILILSPLFLSKFLISILSLIVIIFGLYFVSIGIQLGNGRDRF